MQRKSLILRESIELRAPIDGGFDTRAKVHRSNWETWELVVFENKRDLSLFKEGMFDVCLRGRNSFAFILIDRLVIKFIGYCAWTISMFLEIFRYIEFMVVEIYGKTS